MKKRIYIYITFFLISCFPAISQTNSELFRLADDAFNVGNYNASSHFYRKIINNIDSGKTEGALPYEVRPYNKPYKKTRKKAAVVKDSTSADSSKTVVLKDSIITPTTTANINTDSIPDSIAQIDIHPDKLLAMERLALSYKLLRSYKNAEMAYKNLYDLSAKKYTHDYADALISNEKYKEAMDITNTLLLDQEVGTEEFNRSKSILKRCSFAIQSISSTTRIIDLKRLDTTRINLTGGAYAASYVKDKTIMFSSAHSKGGVIAPNSNIYQIELGANGMAYDDPQNISQLINTEANEGSGVLSPDRTKLYFTRWNYDPKNPECAIYVSRYLNGQWLTPRKLKDNINYPGKRTMHPSLSADGTTLYFTSDRPDGLGKLDIWYCILDEMDNTQEINNPGPAVNTPEDEATPFLHPNNVLYFSSEGHSGLGGLDVFKINVDGGFVPPAKNLGAPINSSKDDTYYISTQIDEMSQSGFLSSDRVSCEDCGDGNCYRIYYFEDKPIVITISGRVYNEDTQEAVPNSMIAFIDIKEIYDPIYVFTDEKGEYKTKLNRNVEYFCTAQKKGFFKDAVTLNTLNINQSIDLVQDFNFILKSIPSGDIVIAGIEYDLNKATLRPESKVRLDSLIDFLTLNDNLIVEISSHTDVRGSDVYNLKLSEARANAVVDYLSEHGIEKSRLVAKGYGETTPIIVDAVAEEDHQKNRRTAFRMLSQDFQPVDKFKYLRTRQNKAVE
jgi:OOP family OmpA-OmpF porin